MGARPHIFAVGVGVVEGWVVEEPENCPGGTVLAEMGGCEEGWGVDLHWRIAEGCRVSVRVTAGMRIETKETETGEL